MNIEAVGDTEEEVIEMLAIERETKESEVPYKIHWYGARLFNEETGRLKGLQIGEKIYKPL